MSIRRRIDRALDWVGDLPGIVQVRQHRYERQFIANTDRNLFRGVYASFDEAAASAPKTRPTGYDNPDSAQIVYGHQVMFYDYPAMFWIAQGLHNGLRSVLDLGGHVGVKYYAFRRPMNFPADLRWTVCDVPAVAEQGRTLAHKLDPERRLQFTADTAALNQHEILYASGSLQYLPYTLGELLGGLQRKPKRIVLNITAVHPERSYFTLNSIGTAFCAYRVQSHAQLVDDVAKCGYALVGNWQNIGKNLDLPFHEGLSLEHYSGYCFDLQ